MDRCKYCGALVPADQLEQHVAKEKQWSRRRPKNWKIRKQPQGKPVRVVHQELPQSSVWTGAPWDHNFANLK